MKSSGGLWDVNETVLFQSPRLGIDETLLISSVEFTFGEEGTLTHLDLTRPDAFIPEPPKKDVVKWGN